MQAKSGFLFLFICCVVNCFSQSDVAADLQQEAAKYQSQNVQEKLFVHRDKVSYTAGDILWFKVYDVNAATHKPLDISKVAYVEIIDRDNRSVLQAKIKMQNGSGSGSFLLPFSLNSDNYILKAYTVWMKNAGSDSYFETPVTIINTLKRTEIIKLSDSVTYDLQFFPEGGNLVSGLTSNVAVKGIDRFGKSMHYAGAVVNSNNDTVARFQSGKLGVGIFPFTPSANEAYKAIVKVNGQVFTKPFPDVYAEGYVMSVKTLTNNQLSISITTNTKSGDPFVYLLIQSNQFIKDVQSRLITNGKAEFIIDKNSLSEGITSLTLYNSRREPLCERVYCRQPKQTLAVNVIPDTSEYTKRKKVNLQIGLQRDSAIMDDANLSVSVYRMDALQTEQPADIYSYLWLNSEIRGNIESPDYLTDTSSEGQKALDNLMLTQGWRRFHWEDFIETASDFRHVPRISHRFYPEYEGQTITATITQRVTGLPAKGVTAYLSIPGSPFQFSNAVSNDSGQLMFSVNRFFGAGQATIQTEDTTGNLYHISVNNPFSQTTSYTYLPPLQLSDKWKNDLMQNSIAVQTQNAYLSDERQRFGISDKGDTTVFYGKPDRSYRLDDYTRFPSMEEVMREYVVEVRMSRSGNNYQYTVDNIPYRAFFKDKPLVLLDGIPVWNTNHIITYDPLLVRQLDVVTHKYYLGSKTYNGIVSYLTYKSDGGGLETNPAAVQFDYEGLQLEREFYSPVYETPQQVNSRLPDFRTTLLWSPDVNIRGNGNQSVSFYTSDLPGDYEVVVQGITSSGLMGSKHLRISIKK